MSDPDSQQPETSRRRGLGMGSVQRGAVARITMRALRLVQVVAWHAIEVLLAVLIVFEEWGWRPLSAALARLAEIDLVARLEMRVRLLSPWPALAVFLVPSLLFLPLKLAALWLIAGGHAVWATLLFVLAKLAGTALYARIFQLTHPALMRLAWFAGLYNWFMPWKAAIVAHAKSTRVWQAAAAMTARATELAKAAWARARPAVMAAIGQLRRLIGS